MLETVVVAMSVAVCVAFLVWIVVKVLVAVAVTWVGIDSVIYSTTYS